MIVRILTRVKDHSITRIQTLLLEVFASTGSQLQDTMETAVENEEDLHLTLGHVKHDMRILMMYSLDLTHIFSAPTAALSSILRKGFAWCCYGFSKLNRRPPFGCADKKSRSSVRLEDSNSSEPTSETSPEGFSTPGCSSTLCLAWGEWMAVEESTLITSGILVVGCETVDL
jgi:hypothetical protein